MAMQGRIPLPALLLLLPCLLVTVAAADADDELGAIRGLVTDADSHKTLAGAVVFVHGTDYGTNASYDGSYVIQCPPGLYVLEASFFGHKSESAKVAVLPGDTAYKDFVLYLDDGWTTQADLEYNPPELVRSPRPQYPPRRPNNAWRVPDTVWTYPAVFYRRPEPQDDSALTDLPFVHDMRWRWVGIAEPHPFFEKYFPDMHFGLMWSGGIFCSSIDPTVEVEGGLYRLEADRGFWVNALEAAGGSLDTAAMFINARATLLAAGFAWQATRVARHRSIHDQTLDETLFHDSIPAFPAVEFVSAERGKGKIREWNLWTDGVWTTFRVGNRERRVFIPVWREPDRRWMRHGVREATPSRE